MCYLTGIINLVVLNQIRIVLEEANRDINDEEVDGRWLHGGGWPVYTRSVV